MSNTQISHVGVPIPRRPDSNDFNCCYCIPHYVRISLLIALRDWFFPWPSPATAKLFMSQTQEQLAGRETDESVSWAHGKQINEQLKFEIPDSRNVRVYSPVGWQYTVVLSRVDLCASCIIVSRSHGGIHFSWSWRYYLFNSHRYWHDKSKSGLFDSSKTGFGQFFWPRSLLYSDTSLCHCHSILRLHIVQSFETDDKIRKIDWRINQSRLR